MGMIFPWAVLKRYLHVQRHINVGEAMGFHLNTSRCEFIASSDLLVCDVMLKFFSRTSIANTSLPGAPLFHGAVLGDAWATGWSDLGKTVEWLKMHWFPQMLSSCYVLLSVLHAFNIFYNATPPQTILLYFSLMNFLDGQPVSFPFLFFLMISGLRPLCQWRIVVWELEGCLCLQLLPVWPLL